MKTWKKRIQACPGNGLQAFKCKYIKAFRKPCISFLIAIPLFENQPHRLSLG